MRRARAPFISREVVSESLGGATAQEARAVGAPLGAEPEPGEAHKRGRLLRGARLPQPKHFEGYDHSQVSSPDGYGPAQPESLSSLDAAEGFASRGRTGRGKARLATAIGARAVSQGRPVRHHETARLARQLERAREDGGAEGAPGDATAADPVILDELGYVPIGAAGARPLFQAVSDCHERRSLAIATDIGLSKRGAALADDRLAAAPLDRVARHSGPVESDGTSRRMDHALMLEGAE